MSLIKPKKNRNIKGLQIAQEAAKPGANVPPHRTGSKAGSSAASDSSSPSMPSSALSTASPSLMTNGMGSSKANKLSEHLSTLELGIEFKLDLRAEDLELIRELGAGNGGTVSRVKHIPTGAIMAKKVVHIDAKPSVRKQIVRELQIMHDCNSKYIVSFYGAYLQDPQICMCMEMMDRGSLDDVYKKNGPVPADILGKITVAVVSGLTYLYDVHRIIHRDVKPSNVLVNSAGQIKICDFGVSGELINSVADTFVGTSTYMSPERIQGAAYTVKSDVWSLGIMLVELALGRFPFAPEDESDDEEPQDDTTLSPARPAGKDEALAKAQAQKAQRRSMSVRDGKTLQPQPSSRKKSSKPKRQPGLGGGGGMSILELLQHVVNEPAPRLPEGKFEVITEQFVDSCLEKDVTKRPTPKQLLKHPWLISSDEAEVDLEGWAATL